MKDTYPASVFGDGGGVMGGLGVAKIVKSGSVSSAFRLCWYFARGKKREEQRYKNQFSTGDPHVETSAYSKGFSSTHPAAALAGRCIFETEHGRLVADHLRSWIILVTRTLPCVILWALRLHERWPKQNNNCWLHRHSFIVSSPALSRFKMSTRKSLCNNLL